jgi:hypothetical protein
MIDRDCDIPPNMTLSASECPCRRAYLPSISDIAARVAFIRVPAAECAGQMEFSVRCALLEIFFSN